MDTKRPKTLVQKARTFKLGLLNGPSKVQPLVFFVFSVPSREERQQKNKRAAPARKQNHFESPIPQTLLTFLGDRDGEHAGLGDAPPSAPRAPPRRAPPRHRQGQPLLPPPPPHFSPPKPPPPLTRGARRRPATIHLPNAGRAVATGGGAHGRPRRRPPNRPRRGRPRQRGRLPALPDGNPSLSPSQAPLPAPRILGSLG